MARLTPTTELAYFTILSLLLATLAPTYLVFVVLLGLLRESPKAKRWLTTAVEYYENLTPNKFEEIEQTVVRRYKTWTADALQRVLRRHRDRVN